MPVINVFFYFWSFLIAHLRFQKPPFQLLIEKDSICTFSYRVPVSLYFCIIFLPYTFWTAIALQLLNLFQLIQLSKFSALLGHYCSQVPTSELFLNYSTNYRFFWLHWKWLTESSNAPFSTKNFQLYKMRKTKKALSNRNRSTFKLFSRLWALDVFKISQVKVDMSSLSGFQFWMSVYVKRLSVALRQQSGGECKDSEKNRLLVDSFCQIPGIVSLTESFFIKM